MKLLTRHFAGALVAVLACNGSMMQPPADTGFTSVDAPTADTAAAPDIATPVEDAAVDADPGYPPGPYGPAVGDTVPNLTLQGYFAPTRTTGLANEETLGEVTFDMLRRSGARFALIQTAGFW